MESFAVRFVEFASIPGVDGAAAQMMLLVDESGTRRMFVNEMRGPLYTVSYDGRTVRHYPDIKATNWGMSVESSGEDQGFQGFAIHPQFGEPGAPGLRQAPCWTDTGNAARVTNFTPGGGGHTHDTILLERTEASPAVPPPIRAALRANCRFRAAVANHSEGHISFNPRGSPGYGEFGLRYVGVAGSGGWSSRQHPERHDEMATSRRSTDARGIGCAPATSQPQGTEKAVYRRR